MLRLGFRVLGTMAPGPAARWAYKLWFRTHRSGEPPRETNWRKDGELISFEYLGGSLAVYTWGEGPTVLLLHGWNGHGTQMGVFAGPLVEMGFRVVAFDAPAHGRSPGKSTNVFNMVLALRAIAQTFGPVHALVTHSFGAMCATMALQKGLSVNKVVCISAPVRLRWMADHFINALAIPPRVQKVFEQMFEDKFGKDIWDRVAADKIARELTIPALIIHDEHDYDVPWQQGEMLARAWPGARFLRTSGLGHHRILRTREVIQAVAEFINETSAATFTDNEGMSAHSPISNERSVQP